MLRAARRLFELWRERIHPAATEEQVAVAFGLMGGGLMLALAGVSVFSAGDVLFESPSWMREVGVICAAAGLPLFLVGLVAALPSRPWLRAMSGAGWLLVGTGLVLFAWWYPNAWNLTVQAPNGFAIGAYILGVTLVAAAAAAGVADTWVRLHRQVEAVSKENPYFEPDRAVTADEIEADLAWASRQGWTWGGLYQRSGGVHLEIRDEPDAMQFAGLGDRVKVMEAPVEADLAAAQALAGLRGRRIRGEDSDTVVNDQVAYLKRLKAEQSEAERQRKASLWYKITHPFG